MRTHITGVATQMQRFDYFFGVEIGRKLLSIVHNLSRALQAATVSACEGQGVVRKTIQALQSVRSDENFDLFWKYLENTGLDVSTPALPNAKTL